MESRNQTLKKYPRRRKVSDKILEALQQFTEKLEQGVPIEAMQIRRVNTPDGPLHTRKHVVLVVK